MSNNIETNKAVVREFYDLAFNQHQPAEAAGRHMGEVYRQHNPGAGDGHEPFIAFVTGFVKAYPALSTPLSSGLSQKTI